MIAKRDYLESGKAETLRSAAVAFEGDSWRAVETRVLPIVSANLSNVRGERVTIDADVHSRLRRQGVVASRLWEPERVEEIAAGMTREILDTLVRRAGLLEAVGAAQSRDRGSGEPEAVSYEPAAWWPLYEALAAERIPINREKWREQLGLAAPVSPEELPEALAPFAGEYGLMRLLEVPLVSGLTFSHGDDDIDLLFYEAILKPETAALIVERARELGIAQPSVLSYLLAVEPEEREIWRQTLVPNPLSELIKEAVVARKRGLAGSVEAVLEWALCNVPPKIPYLETSVHPRSATITITASAWASPAGVEAAFRSRAAEILKGRLLPKITAPTVDFVLAYRAIEARCVKGKQQRFDALPPEIRERFADAKDPAASAFSQYRTSMRKMDEVMRGGE